MSEPDFEKLRAARNAAAEKFEDEMRAKGWQVSHCAHRSKDACYCACAEGGPCEHKWDGKPYESEDGSLWASTCSRCGMTSYSHSLHTS